VLLGASWGRLGCVLGVMDGLWGAFGCLWGVLGDPWGDLGGFLGRLWEASFGHPLGAFGWPWGCLLATLGLVAGPRRRKQRHIGIMRFPNVKPRIPWVWAAKWKPEWVQEGAIGDLWVPLRRLRRHAGVVQCVVGDLRGVGGRLLAASGASWASPGRPRGGRPPVGRGCPSGANLGQSHRPRLCGILGRSWALWGRLRASLRIRRRIASRAHSRALSIFDTRAPGQGHQLRVAQRKSAVLGG
jgi:hypothetical protein